MPPNSTIPGEPVCSDTVVLLGSTASPYSRIARIALLENGISHHWIEVASPARRRVQEQWTLVWEPNEAWAAVAANPLGAIPVLLHQGRAWHDSRVICAYADGLSPKPSLYAAPCCPGELAVPSLFILRVEACCQGICDAIAFSKGVRLRSPKSTADAAEAQARARILATLQELGRLLEAGYMQCSYTSVTMADIVLCVALDYIDFRMPDIGWRKRFPKLKTHYDHLASRDAFASTRLDLRNLF